MGQRIYKLGSTANLAWIGLNRLCCLAGRFYAPFSRILQILDPFTLWRSNSWDLKSYLISPQPTVTNDSITFIKSFNSIFNNPKIQEICMKIGLFIHYILQITIFYDFGEKIGKIESNLFNLQRSYSRDLKSYLISPQPTVINPYAWR